MSRFPSFRPEQKGPIDHPAFWNFMSLLEEADGPLALESVCEELKINDVELSYFLTFLEKLNFQVEVKLSEGEKLIIPPAQSARIAFDFSLKDWLAFQAHFPYLEEASERPFHEVFVEKMIAVEGNHSEYDLFRALAEEGEEAAILQGEIKSYEQQNPELLPSLYRATNDKRALNVQLSDERTIEFYPHKIVYLDGGLSVIGEDTRDRSLVTFYVESIVDLELDEESLYKPNFSPHEVCDFIAAIRAVSGIEERLVLKIVGAPDLNLKPAFLHLGNPYVANNAEGEKIWAASVETSPELYEWLYQIRTHIQILDPAYMAHEFEDYCHQKASERVEELKKAS